MNHYRSFDATRARRVLSSGDAISRLDSGAQAANSASRRSLPAPAMDSVGKHEQ